jgi:uncharacterized protein YfaS (alpha-2-macroglobulin family)
MEHFARGQLMRALAAVLITALLVSYPAPAKDNGVYFSISTNKTFRPGEKPTVHLYANNVNVMEFRVYRVRDPLAFFEKLEDVHSFGPQYSPRERVDEHTWLERFHDWKHEWWVAIRNFFRSQYSAESRQAIRERNSEKAKRSRVTAAAAFAEVPVLNSQQLVARWRMELPPKYVSEASDLPVDSLPAGTYVVEATDGQYRAYTVLLVSQVALVTKSTAGQLLAFTVDRTSGEATPADVTVWRQNKVAAQLKTDKQGLGEAAIQTGRAERGADSTDEEAQRATYGSEWVLARRGDDVALVAPYSLNLSSDPSQDWLGYVYTDRPVYRPGHTVQFKGILRRHNGDALQLPGNKEVEVTIQDPAQNTLLKQKFTLTAFGSFHGKFDVPTSAALGTYWISVKVDRATVNGQFDVEEYRKPEYFVKVTPEKPRVLQGDTIKATIEARYYFGEPVANAKVKYVVHTQRAYFFEDEEQAQELPAGDESGDSPQEYFFGEQVSEQDGKLDANGRLQVSIPTKVEDKYRTDVDYRIEARVTDAANREIAGHNGVLATYGSFHVSAETQSYILRQGDKAQVTVQALDYDKHPVQTAVQVQLLQRKYSRETELQTVAGQTGADGFAKVEVPLTDHGSLTIRATAHTPEGRDVQGDTWLWVMGPNESEAGEEGEARTIRIVADKPSYKVGDTAHVVIVGTVADSTLLVTTEGRTIMSKQIVKGAAENTMVDVPITQQAVPNIQVAAVFVRDDQVYTGAKDLSVPPVAQKLNIEVTPSKQQFQPGEPATYNVVAKDANGKPVEAELSLGVVDDAIYAVRPDMSGNIVSAFYQQRYSNVSTENSLSFYFHGEAGKKSIQLAGRVAGGGGGGDRGRVALAQVKASEFVQPKVRKAFPDTAFWVADLRTDANGHATAKLSFPNSLTTWRTTVRAITADTKAGAALNKVLVRKNLIVRLAVPRFFRQGDEVTISTIVHNYLTTPKTVRMSLDVSGLDLVNGSAQDITVPQRGEAKLDWRVRTKQGTTSTKLLAKALTNEESDAMELTLPVIPFGVKQAVAVSGAISESKAERTAKVDFPASAEATSRGIDIEISPSVAGAIFSSLEYLTSFPYGCTEQTMSSFLPNVIVASTLKDLKVTSTINPSLLKRQVDAGLERLYDFQHDDGGWGWWKEDDSMVFMTAYVVSGMAQAKDAGFQPRNDVIDKGKEFLRKSLKDHPNMIADLRAYVVYALALAGDRDAKLIDTVWDNKEKLTAEGVAFAGLAMQLEGDGRRDQAVEKLRRMEKPEGDTVYWPSQNDYLLDIDVDNSPETTAYAVKLLAEVAPNDPVLPQAVQWMMRHRNDGYYWESTKQTAMVVYGITDYLKVSKELDAAFTADVVVNGRSVLSRSFTAQDTTSGKPATVHLSAGEIANSNTIQVRKNGTGRLYWSVHAPYYSNDKSLYNKGGLSLSIARDYYKLTSTRENDKIVYTLGALNGPVQTGDVLAVRVTIAGSSLKYVMVEDPIPSGTEFIEHDELYEVKDKPAWWRNWYSRREFHDDRAAVFQTYFDKHREYFYLLKVVNPGAFRISPASVQPMYQPNVISTTDPATMEVK